MGEFIGFDPTKESKGPEKYSDKEIISQAEEEARAIASVGTEFTPKNQNTLDHHKLLIRAGVKVALLTCMSVLVHDTAVADDQWLGNTLKNIGENEAIQYLDEKASNPERNRDLQIRQMQERQDFRAKYQEAKENLLMDTNLWTSPEAVRIATDFIDYAQGYYDRKSGFMLSNPNLTNEQFNEKMRTMQEEYNNKYQETYAKMQVQVSIDMDTGESSDSRSERAVQNKLKNIMIRIVGFSQRWGPSNNRMESRNNRQSINQERSRQQREGRIIKGGLNKLIRAGIRSIKIPQQNRGRQRFR